MNVEKYINSIKAKTQAKIDRLYEEAKDAYVTIARIMLKSETLSREKWLKLALIVIIAGILLEKMNYAAWLKRTAVIL